MLNASALSGVIIFTLANIMGMNVGSAPDRLAGTHGFSGSSFDGPPLFDTVRFCLDPQTVFRFNAASCYGNGTGSMDLWCMQVTVLIVALAVLVYFVFLAYLHFAKLGPFNITR